jgi:hypothetical protein
VSECLTDVRTKSGAAIGAVVVGFWSVGLVLQESCVPWIDVDRTDDWVEILLADESKSSSGFLIERSASEGGDCPVVEPLGSGNWAWIRNGEEVFETKHSLL